LGDEQAGAARIFLGDGDGGFDHLDDFPTPFEPHDIDAADFDGDGKTDLVASHGHDDLVSVILGDGDGTFHARRSFEVGPNNRFVATGDFDGDSSVDIAVSNQTSSTVSTWTTTGRPITSPRSTPRPLVEKISRTSSCFERT